MTSSLAAVYNGDLSRVQLTLTGPDGVWLVERSINQLLWTTVRGGAALVVAGGSATLDDFEFAADIENFYRARPIALENLMEVFTSSGTWTKPANLVAVRVRMIGGGGSGGGAAATTAGQAAEGGGGGSGEYSEAYIPAASLGATETVTVGSGATGATAGGNGNTGGTSSFGAHLTALGGSGGSAGVASGTASAANGGAGGTGGGGTASERFHIPGGDGGTGVTIGGVATRNGFGGGSVFGGLANQTQSGSSIGVVGQPRGGGSSGAWNAPSQSAIGSSGGASGIVIVENIFWPPEA